MAKIVAHFGEGVPQCDAFANASNHRFPIWWGCGGVVSDAFPQDWGKIYLWINPPFSQIVRVIDKLVRDRARAILIVPFWPRRQYVRRLASLAAKIWESPPRTELFELEGTQTRPTRWPL